MNDFLSNFSKDKYEQTLSQQAKAEAKQSLQEKKKVRLPEEPKELPTQEQNPQVNEDSQVQDEVKEASADTESPKQQEPQVLSSQASKKEPVTSAQKPTGVKARAKTRVSSEPKATRHEHLEETVVDPTYKKRRRNRNILIAVIVVLLLALLFFLWYTLTHVQVPDFKGKSLSVVKQWGQKNNISIEVEPIFSTEVSPNDIIEQSVAPGKKIRKGKFLSITSSKGADPDETLALPDFSTMSESQASEWIKTHKADNLRIVRQYSDSVPPGDYIKLDLKEKGIPAEEYKRKMSGILYYSRGQESFEKDIEVVNFTGKSKEEVQEWARKNGVNITYEDMDSSRVEAGKIIRQSLTAGTMISKKDPFKVFVSTGQALVVPDFSLYTAENAVNYPGLTYLVETQYSPSVAYGFLIHQSIEPGTKLKDNENKGIHLIYSLGQPYLGDLRGQLNEGELQKHFFDTYQSKGAKVTYRVNYANSDQPRGTIIGQSDYNCMISMDYQVTFTISRGPGDNPMPVLPQSNVDGRKD